MRRLIFTTAKTLYSGVVKISPLAGRFCLFLWFLYFVVFFAYFAYFAVLSSELGGEILSILSKKSYGRAILYRSVSGGSGWGQAKA